MDLLSQTALALGLAWASGLRLYAAVFIAGGLQRLGVITLPPGLAVLSHDWVLIASFVMFVCEFVADKVPAFDTLWDALHTFVRIPAGTLLAWGAFDGQPPAVRAIVALAGGTLVAGTHLTKAAGRALINHSPEPFSNWVASLTEDFVVLAGLWLLHAHPLAFLVVLGLFVLAAAWLLPKLWRGLRWVFRALVGRPAPAL
ncbi:MAG TPA: DUF4126 domain-containing protein [Thermoanaerobaculaceae bacterium]|nr:DUF4126 domain-containing protein [Thermoanaerobaculaceae bacterium]